jgi:ATP-dependent Clp protease ATP-binding subunit ClpA
MSYLFDHRVVMAHLRERIVGQDEALEHIESALTVVQAGISEKDKPLYAALFLGPTGVGKTETVRALSVALCGDVEATCRVDMNTLAQDHYSAALVGAPPGYVGSREENTLLDKDKIEGSFSRPGLVLFDEVEKASDVVIQTVMNILDDGILELTSGTTAISFRNAMIFMTSNVGAREIQDYAHNRPRFLARKLAYLANPTHWGANDAAVLSWIIDKQLHRRFRPEFLNRIDDVVVFNWLDREALAEVLNISISDLNRRLARKNIAVRLSPEVRKFILDVGFDRRFGARFLKRAVRRHVENPLARLLVAESPPSERLTLVALRDPASARLAESVSFEVETDDGGLSCATEAVASR